MSSILTPATTSSSSEVEVQVPVATPASSAGGVGPLALAFAGVQAGEKDDAARLLADRASAGEMRAVCEELMAPWGEQDAEALEGKRGGGKGAPSSFDLAVPTSHPSFEAFSLVMGHLSSYSRMDMFRALPHHARLVTFTILRPSEQGVVIDEADITEAEAYVASLPAESRLDALQCLPHGAVQKVVHSLKADEKAACDFVRCFPEGSVGRLMHRVPPGMALAGSTTVAKAAADVASATVGRGPDPRRTGGIFLIRDSSNALLGWTDAPSIAKVSAGARMDHVRYYGLGEQATSSWVAADLGKGAAPASPETETLKLPAPWAETEAEAEASPPSSSSQQTLANIAFPLVHVLRVDDDADELLRQFGVADYACLPVVDAGGVLLGVVRPRDAVRVLNARYAALLSASSTDTGITSYSKSSVVLLIRKRIVWLLILAALNFGVAAVVGQFEETLSKNLVLAGFIPLLAGMGGNIGAQATGLIISAVSSRDVARTDYLRVLKKELYVGFWLAIILGLICSVMGYIRAEEGSKGGIALVLGVSMAIVALISNVLGVLMPFGSLAVGQDPAVSSSPLITTIIDVVGISLYLVLAAVILGV